MLERRIVVRVMEVARSLGWLAYKQHGGAFTVAGLPDLLLIKNGRATWIEVKRPGESPTTIQKLRIRQLTAAGCAVAVVTSASEARVFLESVL